MKKHLLLTTFLTIAHGFAVFGRLTTTPINQYAFLGNTNYTMRCSSTLGSGSIHWFLIPVGNTVNLTIASGSEVNTEYSQMYLIDQPTVNDSNLIILSPNDSTAGTFMCSDVEMARGALLVVYHDLFQSTNASDNLPIGDVIKYTCQLVYLENPYFHPIFYLQRSEPTEEIANTTSPQLENSNSLITATATFYQTVSCLSFLNMQCVLKLGEPVGSILPDTATNAPYKAVVINFRTVKVSCPPSISGLVSGSILYFGGMLTCKLTVARPVNYSWTDLTYGNSSTGPQLTVWHDGSYECTASINSSGIWIPSATAVYNLTVEKPSVTAKPLYGPIAGGTKVSLTLLNWSKEVSNITAIYLGDSLKSSDLISDSVDNNFVITTPNATAVLIGQPLPITVEFTPGQYNISYNLSFTYRGNPEITSISPSTFVVTGGTIVNVNGTRLSSVANPLIQVKIVIERGGNVTTKKSQQPCEVKAEDGSQMACRMPSVEIPDDFLQALDNQYMSRIARDTNSINRLKPKNPFLLSRRKRYANALSLTGPNGNDSLDITLGFILDGYTKYDNINDVLPSTQILLFSPPEITSTKDIIEFDPNKDESISIKGKYMLRGCRIDDYVVHVGADVCENIDLTDNQLSCRPPKQQPQLTKNGSVYCDQRLSIFINLGFRTYQYACMKYSSHLAVLTIGLAVGLSSFVIVVLLIIVIVCCCKRSRNRRNKSTDNTLGRSAVSTNEAYEPPSDQLSGDDSYLRPSSVQSSYLYASEDREPASDQL